MITTMPMMIYGYTGKNYDKHGDHIYNFTLGLFWLQYAFNICIYMAQRDQYWNAYKDYINEVILRKVGYKFTREKCNVDSQSTLRRIQTDSHKESNRAPHLENILHN